MRKQVSDLDIESARAKQEAREYEELLVIRSNELNKYKAIGVDNYTMGECEEMERKLKLTLEMVSQRKVSNIPCIIVVMVTFKKKAKTKQLLIENRLFL